MPVHAEDRAAPRPKPSDAAAAAIDAIVGANA